MKTSSWVVEHKTVVRLVILAMFILSLFGPWIYDPVNVPAKYDCYAPTVRLEGDFCGFPMSGFLMFSWIVGGFFSVIAAWVTGALGGRGRELLLGLYLFILFPFFTTLLVIWKKESRRLQTINLIAWILALLAVLFPVIVILISAIGNGTLWLLGLWLYIITTISAIIVEMMILKKKSTDI